MTTTPQYRREDRALLTGKGQFVTDARLPNQTRAVFLRSDRAHADILNIDTSAARTMPGVLAVLTEADLRPFNLGQIGGAFAVLPGGIGTLEEVVELMSWRRLGLHAKPIVFLSPDGFWDPLFRLIDHTIEQNLTPAWFAGAWRSVATPEEILPAMHDLLRAAALS